MSTCENVAYGQSAVCYPYVPSNKFSILGLTLACLGSAIIVPFVSYALAFPAQWFHLFMLMPGIAGFLLAAAASWLFRLGHCRHPKLAGVMVGALAVLMYVGHFHAHMVLEYGEVALSRVDLLPQYLTARVNNWQISCLPGQGGKPIPMFNWMFFGVDLVFAVSVAYRTMNGMIGQAYCERCGRWMTRKAFRLAPGTANRVWRAARSDRFDLLSEFGRIKASSKDFDVLELEGCSHQGQPGEPGIYFVTATETRNNGEQISHRELLHRAPLSRASFRTLIEKSPLGWCSSFANKF